jgi:N-acetylmuramoyl-L-alanine amidase
MARIVLDPGHGGAKSIPNDSSWNNAVGPNGTLEKNLALDVALRTRDVLQKAGHDVRMTRDSDVNMKLCDRAGVAKAMRAHAFVSIHFNASKEHNAQGTETLVHLNHSAQSAKLSLDVQDAVLKATGLTDRNSAYDRRTHIKPQALGVLRPSCHHDSTAACLAEISFLDRADEEKRLQDSKYLDKIARGLASGIESYTGAAAVSAPEVTVDAGDAIEASSLESTGAVDVESFLGLAETPSGVDLGDSTTEDRNENPGIPVAPFSSAFVDSSGPPLSLLAGEADWPHLQEFVTFIGKLGLRHFAADEFLFLGRDNGAGRCKGLNTYPKKALWQNIVNTALWVDAIRAELGAPIRITSCYRSPAYNECVGGVSGSMHLQFNAIDFTCSQGTPEIWRRVASRLQASDPRFAGKVIAYPSKKFVHIDTRTAMASNR